jgi:hypothetical protein
VRCFDRCERLKVDVQAVLLCLSEDQPHLTWRE